MTDPSLHPKKREGWLGLSLTVLLCLGFLFWWFRPARETWIPHSTAELVGRAFDLRELQLNLISLSGNIEESDDEFVLHWNQN